MFFDGSFFFKEFCRPLSEEHSCKKKKCYPISGLGGRRFLKVFLLWLPWQPELFMEHNYLTEFERGPPKEHSCEIWLKSSQ